ncbi:RNA polymerase sigma factor [Ferruginibacter sp. HRS2-29]|uniref:RNA polymerase sigma factor n=1 Tax=Ferruginibacter sp. HRS2-29 TaxID=2487334 RepID=UPI0020CF0612|nr:sigma-70 family RNA polymerase sigma factor [Ferruginibacter sp. HRS2-29]MCP9751778.1 sigma-70 family RNA polymerase sigma factor [Ferruginibacter sp. HRS2-29]
MEHFLQKRKFLSAQTDILIKGCQQNELHAQEQLYKLYYAEMIKICFRYAGNAGDAGTIYNNAMLRVFKYIGQYKDEGKPGAWIKTIVVNCCIDFCRQKNNFQQSVPYTGQEEAVIRPEAFDRLSGKEVQQLIAQLPTATATVFNLFVYEGFTHKQIGGHIGISDSTSKWHVAEAKKLLKQKLETFTETELQRNAAG